MAYARHQSFYLRDKWISKGLKAVKESPRFFFEDDSPEEVGLGKNMVQSLRFWLIATGVIREEKINKQTEHYLTEVGELLLQTDRLLQRNDTVSILHYNLVENKEDLATVFNWFFNIYKDTITQRDSLLKSFITYVTEKEGKTVSSRSLKRDIDCLVQLYTKQADEDDPEDAIFSPFSTLRLMKEEPSEEGHENVRKVTPKLEDLGIISLYYVLLVYGEMNDTRLISLDEIINNDNLWAKVFNMNRSQIIEVLNELTNHTQFPLEYVRTNNLDNVKLPNITSLEFLEYEYGYSKVKEPV